MVNPDTKLEMRLTETTFPFSKRMQNFLNALEVETVGELAAIPLENLKCFRGFKAKCKEELVRFIETEKITNLFADFERWK